MGISGFGTGKEGQDCIISSVSPLTGLTARACVENDCSYLYLYQTEDADGKSVIKNMSTCWIKNHTKVGDSYSPKKDMKKGLQPKIPTKFCDFQDDMGFLDAGRLEIVWGKEGVMVSLYEGEELLCVLPYWADNNFPGYSKYSYTSQTPMIPFPLGSPDSNELFKRMGEARVFWKQDFAAIWKDYQESYLAELENRYGKLLHYYAIDGGCFPPKALAVFEENGVRYAFTIGIGLFPQPTVEMFFDDFREHELIELGFSYQPATGFDEMGVLSQISSIAGIPWGSCTFLGHHHTVGLEINEQHGNAVLVSDKSAHFAGSEFLGGHGVDLLWLVPVTGGVYEKLTAEPSDYSDVEARASASDIVYRG